MGHETGDDDLLAARGLQLFGEIRLREGVGQRLLHHRFGTFGRQFAHDTAALVIQVEGPAGFAPVLHMHDRRARRPRALQQRGDLSHRRVHPGQRQRARAVFVLCVDDNQGGL